MTTQISNLTRAGPPNEADTRLAQDSSRTLSRLLASRRADLRFRVQEDGRPGETITLPKSALRLLADILTEMAKGNAVSLLPVSAELTTQQAADLLNVSRPYLIGLLEGGKIPFRLVGRHRRVRLDDLIAYKHRDDETRRRVAEELTADAQELGMGY